MQTERERLADSVDELVAEERREAVELSLEAWENYQDLIAAEMQRRGQRELDRMAWAYVLKAIGVIVACCLLSAGAVLSTVYLLDKIR